MPEATKLDLGIKFCMALVAIVSAVIGLYTFWRSTRTKAAEFLSDLHKAFFVETTYKKVRKTLDEEADSAQGEIAILGREWRQRRLYGFPELLRTGRVHGRRWHALSPGC